MPEVIRIVVAIWLVVSLQPAAPCLCADGQSGTTLVLNQVSDVCGHITTYVNERAIKITFVDRPDYLVASAPTWKVMLCNGSNKKALSMSLEQWLKHVPQMTYAAADWDRFELTLARKYLIKRDGRDLRRFTIVGMYQGKRIVPCQLARNSEYLVIEGAPVAAPACFIMQKVFSCPKVPGLPVEFTNHRKASPVEGFRMALGGDDHWLTTTKIDSRTVPTAFFGYPTGYTPVPREVDVINDGANQGRVEDLVKEFLPSH